MACWHQPCLLLNSRRPWASRRAKQAHTPLPLAHAYPPPNHCRRADTLQLGPLRMARPLLMELPMSGIVSGVPDGGRVVGIVGCACCCCAGCCRSAQAGQARKEEGMRPAAVESPPQLCSRLDLTPTQPLPSVLAGMMCCGGRW